MRKTILWILQIVSAFILIGPAWSKISSAQQSIALFEALGMEPYGRVIIGIIESGAVVCLLLPKVHSLGALMSLSVMIGALIAHTTVIGMGGNHLLVPMMLINIVSSTLILYLRRDNMLVE